MQNNFETSGIETVEEGVKIFLKEGHIDLKAVPKAIRKDLKDTIEIPEDLDPDPEDLN